MPNRLASQTSPYLLQHTDNPVDWHPWGEEALALAREQDKPILLSIGYSACHWCHVMAHECFEDPEVAALMNAHFVNIKVDREERPDLDQIYQTAHYMLTRRNGGWPLTLFLTPDQIPFFGGTYFPKLPRYNLPGFMDLLPRVAELYRTRRDDIERQNESLLHAFSGTLPVAEKASLDLEPLDTAYRELREAYDPQWGGFGGAPKFPRPTDLEFCLRYAGEGDYPAQAMALHTLERIIEGGVYDQIGGGFCRYSVDEQWMIPHFEKMLYDNGPLLSLCAWAYLTTGKNRFREAAEDTAAWVMREMQSPGGAYHSTLDADSEHEEGKFYVWTPKEVESLLSPEEYAVTASRYGLDAPANFEHTHWHLHGATPLDQVAAKLNISPEVAETRLQAARAKLFAAREQRVRPGRDDKVLVSWNALMVKGMADGARVFGRPEWVRSAQAAVDFIRTTMWRDGHLLATCKDGKAHLNAYLDDYAFLVDGLLALMSAEFRSQDLEFAVALADALLNRFEDPQSGGFYFTGHDHEALIHRPKPGHDNAMPSGNGVAAYALQRLGHLVGDARYLAAAERTLALFFPAMRHNPSGFTSLLKALEEHELPPSVVLIRGEETAAAEWADALSRRYLPRILVLSLAGEVDGLPQAMDKPVSAGSVNAWVCQGVTCLPPIANLSRLLQLCCGDGKLSQGL